MLNFNLDDKALAQAFEDGEVVLNGHTYKYNPPTRKISMQILGLLQKMQAGQFAVGDPEWEKLETHLFNQLTYDGSMLTRLPQHFEQREFQKDYFPLMGYGAGLVSYPFVYGSPTE
jgi:hypothetical protein